MANNAPENAIKQLFGLRPNENHNDNAEPLSSAKPHYRVEVFNRGEWHPVDSSKMAAHIWNWKKVKELCAECGRPDVTEKDFWKAKDLGLIVRDGKSRYRITDTLYRRDRHITQHLND